MFYLLFEFFGCFKSVIFIYYVMVLEMLQKNFQGEILYLNEVCICFRVVEGFVNSLQEKLVDVFIFFKLYLLVMFLRVNVQNLVFKIFIFVLLQEFKGFFFDDVFIYGNWIQGFD